MKCFATNKKQTVYAVHKVAKVQTLHECKFFEHNSNLAIMEGKLKKYENKS